MIKQNKVKLLVSSIITLLPILFGMMFWDRLPDRIATHWGANGEANGYSGKAFAVFGIPLLLLAVHWLCMVVTSKDVKNKRQNRKAFGMVFWLIPAVSVYTSAVVYASALGMKFKMDMLMLIFIGILFITVGNYLPKCKQNHTIGIRVSWALRDEENWNKTHRFGGKMWVLGGTLCLISAFLPSGTIPYALLVILIPIAGLPILYSYLYDVYHLAFFVFLWYHM